MMAWAEILVHKHLSSLQEHAKRTASTRVRPKEINQYMNLQGPTRTFIALEVMIVLVKILLLTAAQVSSSIMVVIKLGSTKAAATVAILAVYTKAAVTVNVVRAMCTKTAATVTVVRALQAPVRKTPCTKTAATVVRALQAPVRKPQLRYCCYPG